MYNQASWMHVAKAVIFPASTRFLNSHRWCLMKNIKMRSIIFLFTCAPFPGFRRPLSTICLTAKNYRLMGTSWWQFKTKSRTGSLGQGNSSYLWSSWRLSFGARFGPATWCCGVAIDKLEVHLATRSSEKWEIHGKDSAFRNEIWLKSDVYMFERLVQVPSVICSWHWTKLQK